MLVDVAAGLLAGFAQGSTDPAELIAEPALVVDADGPAGQIEVPPGLPAVVIALSRSTPVLPAAGADIALTTVTDPPAPWVHAPDPVAEADRLADLVAERPAAATVLAFVLRASPRLDVGAGLGVESLAYSTLQAGTDFGRWLSSREGRSPRRKETAAPLVASRHGDLLDIELDRPEVHNAYNAAMRDALYEAFSVAAAEPSLRVRITGRGRSFCSGGDLSEFGTAPDPATAHLVRTGRSPARLIASMAERVEVHVHGVCAGSGIELPAFAGRVVADPDTRIWLPELAMGLIPGAGGTVSLPRRIGAARTAWLAISGDAIDAATAARWGLVDDVAPRPGRA